MEHLSWQLKVMYVWRKTIKKALRVHVAINF